MTIVAVDPALVDTNVLLEATDERRRYHADAVALLESVGPLTLSAQIIREYLVVATRPVTVNGLGMPVSDALANVREFRRSVRLLAEERPILPTFLALLERVPCTGKRMHDAHIVATALAHRVRTIVSLNPGDFAAFASGVAILTPAQALTARSEASERASGGSPRRPRRRTSAARRRPTSS